MSACKRAAIVVFAFSLAALALAVLGKRLHAPFDDYLLGLLAGLGAGGLFLAAFMWFLPGNFRDSAPPALTRRYYREFFPPMAAYVAVMLVWAWLLKRIDATWLRVLVALLPALLVLLVIRAMARYVRDSDEMQRRIELESVAIAAGAVGAAYMGLGFLQSAKLIAARADAAMLWVFPAMCLCYGVAKLFIARRYA
jgi:hypothetical protein